MTNELLNEWKKEKIVEDGDIVLAGVSGGADSVCLLLMLEQLQKKTDFLLEAVHVEHGIRGEESRKDAAFVKNLCQDHGIRCHIFSVEVPFLRFLPLSYNSHILKCALLPPSQDHVSPQIQELPEKKIRLALAHHAEDNAETVLFQMVRGSGLDGLCGMSRRRDEGIYELIRPLLAQPREEIEEFLKECGQSYCTDETNLDTEYSRNRIRHQVLPELKQINGQAVAHINQSAAFLQEMRDFLNEEAEHIREMYVVSHALYMFSCDIFFRSCHLSDRLMENLQKVFDGETLELEVPGGRVRFCGLSPDGKIGEIDKKSYTKWLNYDKIKVGLQIRTRTAGAAWYPASLLGLFR